MRGRALLLLSIRVLGIKEYECRDHFLFAEFGSRASRRLTRRGEMTLRLRIQGGGLGDRSRLRQRWSRDIDVPFIELCRPAFIRSPRL